MKKLQRRRILLSLLPLAILLCFVYGYSLVTVLFSAFTGFTGSSAGKFVGMKNFQLIFKDIWPTVKITLIWTFGSVLPAMVAGLALAVFCNRNFKGKKAAVSINLIPYAIPLIIVASCWRFVYNPDFGVLNVLLSKLGLIEKPISFLGFDLALLSVIIARIWRAMPFAFMNYYSALTTIPKDLYEAAAIDGASPSQAFWNITMPHLRTTTSSTLLVLTVVFALFHRQVFRIRLKHLPIFLGSGLISILLLSVVYFQCQTMCSLSVAAVLLYLAPSFVVLASAVLWKTPLTKGKIAALCVSLLGCIMVSGVLGGDMTASWAGIGLGVVSGMCYASYTVFSHYGLAHYESYTMIYWTFLAAGLGSVFFADIPSLLPVFQQPKGAIGGICVVVVATVLPYIFYTKGLEGVESGRASIITNIEPVVETLVGITVFHEALTVWTVLGVGCVIGCVALLAREGKHERKIAAAQ